MLRNVMRFLFDGHQVGAWNAHLVLAFVTVLFCQSANANPTGDKPTTPLKNHGTVDGASEMIGKLYGLLNSVEPEIARIRAFKKTPEKIKPESLRKMLADVWQAERELNRLSATGETALVDLSRRITGAHERVRNSGFWARSTPAGRKFHDKMLKKHTKEARSRQKLIAQATETIQKGRGASMLRKVEGAAGEYYGDLICESPVTRANKMKVWSNVLAGVSQAIQPAIKEKVRTGFQGAISEDREIVDSTRSQLGQIVEGVSSTFPIEMGDQKMGSATEVMQYAFSQVAVGHAALQRMQMRQQVFENKGSEPDVAASRQFASQATDGLAAIINKLVEVSDPASGADLHGQLMRQIASYNYRQASGVPKLADVAAETMDALTKRTPSLAESVPAYQRATQPVIDFRKQFVAARVKKLVSSGYQECSTLLSKKTPRPGGFRGSPEDGKTLPDTVIADTKIATRLPWQVAEASARLVGQKVSDGPSYRLSPGSRTGVVAFHQQHYVNLSVSLQHDTQTESLKRVLLVDDQHGPLSPEAAALISAAELKDYDRVGGTIGRVHAESFATRFATLPPIAAALVPIGSSASVGYDGQVSDALCWRVDLRPEWFATESFVVYASGSAGKVAAR